MVRTFASPLGLIALLLGCGTSSFSSQEKGKNAQTSSRGDSGNPVEMAQNRASQETLPGQTGEASAEAFPDAKKPLASPESLFTDDPKSEVFSTELPPIEAPTDVLFVLDDSISMADHLAKVRAGLASLPLEQFPAQARLGFMTTGIADPKDLSQPHPAMNKFTDLRGFGPMGSYAKIPGYLSLINKESISKFKADTAIGEKFRSAFTLPGCDAWVTPGAKDALGNSCLASNAQIPLAPIGCEAGIVALTQLVRLNATQGGLFRKNAAVNVIFISDTHDPGCLMNWVNDPAVIAAYRSALNEARPKSPEELAGVVKSAQLLAGTPISAFSAHTISPQTEACQADTGEDAPEGFTYRAVANGLKIDICTTVDYSPVLKGMIRSAERGERVIPLSTKVAQVQKVFVNGQPFSGFALDSAGQNLVLKDVILAEKLTVKIQYLPQ